MPTVECLDILEIVQGLLQMARGHNRQKVYMQFKIVLNENSGLKILKRTSKIPGEESVNIDGLPEDILSQTILVFISLLQLHQSTWRDFS